MKLGDNGNIIPAEGDQSGPTVQFLKLSCHTCGNELAGAQLAGYSDIWAHLECSGGAEMKPPMKAGWAFLRTV